MRFIKVEIKTQGRFAILYDKDGNPTFRDYHGKTNELFEKSNRQRLIYIAKKKIRQGEFTLLTASTDNYEKIEPYAVEYIQQLGGTLLTVTVTQSSWKEFIDGMHHASYMGYLKNGEQICRRMSIKMV